MHGDPASIEWAHGNSQGEGAGQTTDFTDFTDSVPAENPCPSVSSVVPDVSTDFQLDEWTRRQDIVRQVLELRAKGISLNAASRTIGEPVANLSRYVRAFEAKGADGLKPDISTGRPTKFNLTAGEKAALRLENLKRGSFALAVEWFTKDPACTPGTRALILAELDAAATDRRQPAWPVSLRRAGAVSDEERALFRGEKSFQDVEHCDRRGNFYVDEAGQRHMMAPNVLWESDDMSLNEGFTFVDPETGEIRTGRQSLNTLDVFSKFWLAGQPVGRPRDAYRVEDIADHMLGCIDAHGMPLHWRLERGVWENDFVKGIIVRRSGIPAACAEEPYRWGGLSPLFRIHFTWKSRGKGTIEQSFDPLQSFMAHASTSIGRHRGEFEHATRLWLKASQGDPEAAAYFWPIDAAADGLIAAMIHANQRPQQRRAHGRAPVVAADLFQSAPRRDLPAGERWRFCPIKAEATVRQGHIETVVPHYPLPFRFRVNGEVDGLYLTHGHRVLIAFHPGRPEEGCHVFNAEGQNERNRDGHRFAAPLLGGGSGLPCAPFAEDAPQFSVHKDDRQFHARKNARAAVVTAFRGITKAGTPIVRRWERRDGWGNREANFAASAAEARTSRAPLLDPVTGTTGTNRTPNTPTPATGAATRRNISPTSDDDLAELDRLEAEARDRGDLQPI